MGLGTCQFDDLACRYKAQFDSRRFVLPESDYRHDLYRSVTARRNAESSLDFRHNHLGDGIISHDLPETAPPKNSRNSLVRHAAYWNFGDRERTFSLGGLFRAPKLPRSRRGNRSVRCASSDRVFAEFPAGAAEVQEEGCRALGPTCDQRGCVAQYLKANTPVSPQPRRELRDQLRYIVDDFLDKRGVQSFHASARCSSAPETRLVDFLWEKHRFWPLHRLKRKFTILRYLPKKHQSRLVVCGRPIRPKTPGRHDGRNSLALRYERLCQGDGDSCQDQRSPVPAIRDTLPYFRKKTPSLTDVVKYFLESHEGFQSPDGTRPRTSIVAVGPENIPVDDAFIQNLSAVLDDERFSPLTSDPDRKSLVAARVTITALEKGLIDTLKILEENPAEVLGEWSDYITNPKIMRESLAEEPEATAMDEEVPESFSSDELPMIEVQTETPSLPAIHPVRNSDAHAASMEDFDAGPIMDDILLYAERFLDESEGTGDFLQVVPVSDHDSDWSDADSEDDTVTQDARNLLEEILSSADMTEEQGRIRERFESVKQDVRQSEGARKLSSVVQTMMASDIFVEVVQQRLIINQRKRDSEAAQIRRSLVEGVPLAQHSPGGASGADAEVSGIRTSLGPEKLRTASRKKSSGVKKVARWSRASLKNKGMALRTSIPSSLPVASEVTATTVVATELPREKTAPVIPVLPARVIEYTEKIQKQDNRLLSQFSNRADPSCREDLPGRDFASPETVKDLSVESQVKYRQYLESESARLRQSGKCGGRWEILRHRFRCFPYRAHNYLERASLMEARLPKAAVRDLGMALLLDGHQQQPQGRDVYLQRGIAYLKLGSLYYDYALRDFRSAEVMGKQTPEGALGQACYFYQKREYFRAEAYFATALQLLECCPETVWIRHRIMRALALLSYRAQKYKLALDIWMEASATVGMPDSVFFLFAGVCLHKMYRYNEFASFIRTFTRMSASRDRHHRLWTIYSNILLGEVQSALCSLTAMDPLELFFYPKLLMVAARIFWITGHYSGFANCLEQCRVAKQLVHPARDGVDCGDRTITFLELLASVQDGDSRSAFLLAKKGRQRWPFDFRFAIWFGLVKYSMALEWDRKPWAEVLLKKLCDQYPSNQFIWYARARCAFYNKHKPRKALVYLSQAVQIAPEFYEAYFFRANMKALISASQSAHKDARVCCRVFPESAMCLALYGYCSLLVHQYKTALVSFLKTLTLHRRKQLNWLLLVRAWTFYKWDLLSYALRDYELLLKRHPNNPHIVKSVALTTWHLKGQRYVSSLLHSYQKLLNANPNLSVLYALSHFFQSQRNTYGITSTLLQQILHCYPLHYLARFSSAVVLYWSRQFAAAACIFESLRDLGDKTFDESLRELAQGALGVCLFQSSQYARSLNILESVANAVFPDAYFYAAFGYIRMVMKLPNEARKAFKKAVILEPENQELKFLIAGFYMVFNYADKACEFYTDLINGENLHYKSLSFVNRALAYNELGHCESAVEDMETVQSINPDFWKIGQQNYEIFYLDLKKRLKDAREKARSQSPSSKAKW